jgi:hypothetical protein
MALRKTIIERGEGVGKDKKGKFNKSKRRKINGKEETELSLSGRSFRI